MKEKRKRDDESEGSSKRILRLKKELQQTIPTCEEIMKDALSTSKENKRAVVM